MLTSSGPIVIYDSGVGGLTVSRHLSRLRPADDFVYVADNAWFPYGDKDPLALRARVYTVLHTIVETFRPLAVVIACNTASTAVAATLEEVSGAVPMFAVVPPVEQALRELPEGRHVLLATPNTVRSGLVRRLDAMAPPGRLTTAGSMELVHIAERKLAGELVAPSAVASALDALIAPAERARVDGVVLGCTHFPWLLDELRAAFPAARRWYDPAQATAHRVAAATRPDGRDGRDGLARGSRRLLLTGERGQDRLRRVFSRQGFSSSQLTRMPAAPSMPAQEYVRS